MVVTSTRPYSVLIVLLVGLIFWLGVDFNPWWLLGLLGFWFLYMCSVADVGLLRSVWVMRILMISCGLCLPFVLLGLIGFQFLNITGGISESKIVRATGRNLNEWFCHLDHASASSASHAEIMALLSGFGLSYSHQRLITIAYLQSRERTSMTLSRYGSLSGLKDHFTFSDSLIGSHLRQFRISHLFFATFVVACVLQLANAFGWPFPTNQELVRGGMATLGGGVLLAILSLEILSLKPSVGRTTIRLLLVVALVVVIPLISGGDPTYSIVTGLGGTYYGCLTFVVLCCGLFALSLYCVRFRGYRIGRIKSLIEKA